MRAAAIFGPGSSEKDLKPFHKNSDATWVTGLPASSNEADAVLIFGGDGTIHHHLGHLVNLRLPVLIVPRGSGNDFARALTLKRVGDAVAAWRKFMSDASNVRAIDLGVIISHAADPELLNPGLSSTSIRPGKEAAGCESGTAGLHYFCCVAGIGLDAEVARRANKLPRWIRAHGGYAFTLPAALFRFAPFPMRLSVPDPVQPGKSVLQGAKPTILAAFANAPSYGGGMQIAPQAKLDDGQLDICLINDMDKFRLFCLFPTVYFGRHLRIPEVEYFQTSAARIETERPLDVYADGEYVCQTPIQVGIARSALNVIVPAG